MPNLVKNRMITLNSKTMIQNNKSSQFFQLFILNKKKKTLSKYLFLLLLFCISTSTVNAQKQNRTKKKPIQQEVNELLEKGFKPLNKKPYYKKIFTTEQIAKLEAADKEAQKATKLMNEADKIYQTVLVYRNIEEGSISPKVQKKAAKNRSKHETEAWAKQLEALGIYTNSNQQIYTIYHSLVTTLRREADAKLIISNRPIERMAERDYNDAQNLKKSALQMDSRKKIEALLKVDDLEQKAIKEYEIVIMIYNKDNPIEAISAEKKELAKAKKIAKRLDSLIATNPTQEVWLKEITGISDEIQALRYMSDSAGTGGFSYDAIAQQIKRLEQEEVQRIGIAINDSEQRNQKRFYNYKNDFEYYALIRDTTLREREAIRLEKSAINDFNQARQKIEEAYVQKYAIDQLVIKDKKTPAEQQKLMNLKSEITGLLIEARSLEDRAIDSLNVARDYYELYGNIKKKTLLNNNQNNNNQTTDKKTTTKKTTTKKTPHKTHNNIHFKVQVSSLKTAPTKDSFNGLPTISSEKMSNGFIAYLAGNYKNPADAEKTLKTAQSKGFDDAFIVAYYNGKRISYPKALSMIKDDGTTTSTPTTTSTDNTTGIKYTQSITKNPNATNNTVKGLNIKNIPGVVYSVQIAYAPSIVKESDLLYINPIYQEKISTGIKYMAGIFETEAKAILEKNKIASWGIYDAFVVAYFNGQRIEVEEARKKEKELEATIKQSNKLNQSTNNQTEIKTGIFFTVQISAYKGSSQEEINKYKHLAVKKTIEEYIPKNSNELTALVIGQFKTFNEAQTFRNHIAAKGYTDSFVVAIKNGQKISTETALKLIKQQ